jgi:hypothetical protein
LSNKGTITITGGSTGGVTNNPPPDPTLPGILAELSQAAESVYADGVEYIKMWIWRDPVNSTAIFKQCFLNCNAVVVPLKIGQTVHVAAAGWDVIYGAQEQIVDEYTGEATLDVSTATIGSGSLDIQLTKAPYTNVYFRINAELSAPSYTTFPATNNCGCDLPTQVFASELTAAKVSTNINYNGAPVTIYGGGSITYGTPPTILGAIEPLIFQFIGLFINGVSSNQIVIDNQTQNIIVAEIIWKNEAVPDGTPITVTFESATNVSGQGLPITIPTTVFSYTSSGISAINNTGAVRSFVNVVIPALPTTLSYTAVIGLICDYNATGNVDRTQDFGVEFSYYISQPFVASNPSTSIEGTLERYDLISGDWSQLASMNKPRAGFPLVYFEDYLFAISGTDGAILHPTVEKYDIAGDSWVIQNSDIPTPRIYGQTVQIDNFVYMIGGMIVNIDNSTALTGTVDRYDMVNDIWEEMSPLPTGYEIAFGIAQVVNGFIYVMSGYQ